MKLSIVFSVILLSDPIVLRHNCTQQSISSVKQSNAENDFNSLEMESTIERTHRT